LSNTRKPIEEFEDVITIQLTAVQSEYLMKVMLIDAEMCKRVVSGATGYAVNSEEAEQAHRRIIIAQSINEAIEREVDKKLAE